FCYGSGRTHDGIVGSAEVARENNAFILYLDCHDCRAEDVARRQQAKRYVLAQFAGFSKCDGLEALAGEMRVLIGEKRKRLAMFGKPMFVGVTGFLFLEITGIRQQDTAQVPGRSGAIDTAWESVFDQHR